MFLFEVANSALVDKFKIFPHTLFIQFNLSCQVKYFINPHPLENLVPLFIYFYLFL